MEKEGSGSNGGGVRGGEAKEEEEHAGGDCGKDEERGTLEEEGIGEEKKVREEELCGVGKGWRHLVAHGQILAQAWKTKETELV